MQLNVSGADDDSASAAVGQLIKYVSNKLEELFYGLSYWFYGRFLN